MIIICKGLQVTLSVNGNVTEGDGNVTITATASRIVTDSVTISLSIKSGTAGKSSCIINYYMYQTFHGILLLVRDQDFTVINEQFVIPAGEMSVMVEIFNPKADDLFEMIEDFTISVVLNADNSHIILETFITIIIMDNGLASPSKYPYIYMLCLAKELTGNCTAKHPIWDRQFQFQQNSYTVPIS